MFRRWGFCGWSFLPSNNEVLAVEDLTNDARRVFSSHFRVSFNDLEVPGSYASESCILTRI